MVHARRRLGGFLDGSLRHVSFDDLRACICGVGSTLGILCIDFSVYALGYVFEAWVVFGRDVLSRGIALNTKVDDRCSHNPSDKLLAGKYRLDISCPYN